MALSPALSPDGGVCTRSRGSSCGTCGLPEDAAGLWCFHARRHGADASRAPRKRSGFCARPPGLCAATSVQGAHVAGRALVTF